MDAKEYVRERLRMLNACGGKENSCAGIDCADCPLFDAASGCQDDTEKAVDIVEQWSEEHPKKTYLDVLLEAFPNTPINKYGMPLYVTCPYTLGLEARDEELCRDLNYDCDVCWNREYKERG